MRRRRSAALTGVTGIAAMLIAFAPGALAHDTLLEASPAAGSVLDTPPREVSLSFDSVLMDVGAALVVRDSGGELISRSPDVKGRVIHADLDPSVAPGTYTVGFRIVSKDGHVVTSSYEYTIAGGITASSPASPVSQVEVPAAAPASDTSAEGDETPGSFPWLLLLGALVVVSVAALGALALKR